MLKKVVIFSLIIACIGCAFGIITNQTGVVALAESKYKASFYADRGEEAYLVINEQKNFTFPDLNIVREGYTFAGWAEENADLGALHSSGSVYQGELKKDTNFYAVWEPVYPEQKPSGIYFSMGEKIALIVAVAILLGLIAFSYQFFVIKKKSFKDLMFWKKNKD